MGFGRLLPHGNEKESQCALEDTIIITHSVNTFHLDVPALYSRS